MRRFPKKKTSIVILTIIFLSNAACLFAAEEKADPPELVKLRTSWKTSLEKGGKEARDIYQANLTKLQNRLARTKKHEDVDIVKNEIKSFSAQALGPVTIPSWEKRPPLSGLKFARAIFRRKITETIETQNKTYRHSLENLKMRYINADTPESAKAVDRELAKLISGEALAEFSPSALPRSAEQLEIYLADTQWTVAHFKGKKGQFKFHTYGTVDMLKPWSRATWKAKDRRSITVSHINGHWTFNITFSDDMKKLEGFQKGDTQIHWTGIKS